MTDVTKEYLQNATPGVGELIFEENFVNQNGELEFAEWYKRHLGGDIILRGDATKTNPNAPRSADYLKQGKLWELKSMSAKRKDTYIDRLNYGLTQIDNNPGGIMIDITKSPYSITEIAGGILKYAATDTPFRYQILLRDGEEFRVFDIK